MVLASKLFLFSLDLIKEAFLEILLLLMLTCLLVAWQHLEVHFYLSSNALKCHTLWVLFIFPTPMILSLFVLELEAIIFFQSLDEVTFVDTPGDFIGVVSWFAAKCDIILLFPFRLYPPFLVNSFFCTSKSTWENKCIEAVAVHFLELSCCCPILIP